MSPTTIAIVALSIIGVVIIGAVVSILGLWNRRHSEPAEIDGADEYVVRSVNEVKQAQYPSTARIRDMLNAPMGM